MSFWMETTARVVAVAAAMNVVDPSPKATCVTAAVGVSLGRVGLRSKTAMMSRR